MSDRARVILVLSAVALVGGGGGFYFFKIYRPAQDLKNAQSEIAEWEARYQSARECLLGKTPGSSKTSEALAIRELTPDPWERGKCTPLISKLNRGEGQDTGVPAVEASWNDLDKAAQTAALAFARHVSESTLEHDPLPTALDELDAARQKLRSAAKLPASAGTGQPLPRAQTVPIGDAKTLTQLTVDAIPSAHGLILFGSAGESQSQVVLTTGAEPKVMSVTHGTFRGVPDMTWGAVATQTNVLAGTLDANAGIGATFSQDMPLPTIAAVGGSLVDGVLVFGNATDLVIARAKDRQITAAPPLKIVRAEAVVDVDGRTVVVWTTKDKTQAQIFEPGAPDQPAIEVPSIDAPCMTRDRVWGTNNGSVVSFGGGRPVFQKNLEDLYPHPAVEFHGTETAGMTEEEIAHYHSRGLMLVGCTPDAAIFRDHNSSQSVVVCSDDCKIAAIPESAPDYSTLAYAKGKVIGVASHGGVLGVWREGDKPMFYALPEDAHPMLAHEWYALALTDNKVIDVIARVEKRFVVIRIPAG